MLEYQVPRPKTKDPVNDQQAMQGIPGGLQCSVGTQAKSAQQLLHVLLQKFCVEVSAP